MEGQQGEAGGDGQRHGHRHAALQEAAGAGVHRRERENLEDAVHRRAGRAGAEEGDAQAVQTAGQQRMEDGVLRLVAAPDVLRDFKLKVVVEDAGEVRQQRRAIADGEEQEEGHKGDAALRYGFRARGPAGTKGIRAGLKGEGAKRAQQRHGHHGDGKAPDQAAHARKKLLIAGELAADAQEEGEDEREAEAVEQRAAAVPLKRRADRERRGQQKDGAEHAVAEDGAVRIGGNQIGRGKGGSERGQQREKRAVLSEERMKLLDHDELLSHWVGGGKRLGERGAEQRRGQREQRQHVARQRACA